MHLTHPKKTKAITSARIKTDKIDFKILAHLLRTHLPPTAHIPEEEAQERREILRTRIYLTKLKTSIKNRIHSLLAKNGVIPSFSDLFGKEDRKFLRQLFLPWSFGQCLKNHLAVLEVLETKIAAIDSELNKVLRNLSKKIKDEIHLFPSIPGIGIYSPVLLLPKIGEIERFNLLGTSPCKGGDESNFLHLRLFGLMEE